LRETRPTVLLVKKHLDVLREGVQLVKRCEVELTDEAVAALGRLRDALTFHVEQLRAADVHATNVDAPPLASSNNSRRLGRGSTSRRRRLTSQRFAPRTLRSGAG
jgi:hypothetical protein